MQAYHETPGQLNGFLRLGSWWRGQVGRPSTEACKPAACEALVSQPRLDQELSSAPCSTAPTVSPTFLVHVHLEAAAQEQSNY